MNVDEATVLLIVLQMVGIVISYFVGKRALISSILDVMIQIFEKPAVSRAMGVLGKASGEKRHHSALVDKMAGDVLDSPRMKGLKAMAKGIGIDVDAYIMEHGAQDTMETAFAIAGMLGVDVSKILAGDELSIGSLVSGGTSSGENPYWK